MTHSNNLSWSAFRRRDRFVLGCALLGVLGGCSGTVSDDPPSTGDAGSRDGSRPARDAGPLPDGSVAPSPDWYTECGGRIFDPETGALDTSEYERQARLWDRATIDCRLGRTAEALGITNDRPALTDPPDAARCGTSGAFDRFQYGPSTCTNACPDGPRRIDYQSTSAQVGYEPDDVGGAGVDRIFTFGAQMNMVAVAPQPANGERWHPDADLDNPHLLELGIGSRQPIAMQRAQLSGGYAGHQALVVFDDGFVGAMGTRTDGPEGVMNELQVGYRFPAHLVPTDVAVTTMNELAVVTVWDTDEHVGRLAVFAMHSNFPLGDAATWWYIGLPSSGTFTGMKLLGYVDLPFRTPTSVAVVTNGKRSSPHDTGMQNLGSFGLIEDGVCQPDVAAMFSVETDEPQQNSRVVASHGYALVASQWEHQVALVDLRPLLTDLRDAYFEDMERCSRDVAPVHVWSPNPSPTQFAGDDRFPFAFTHGGVAPEVVAVFDVPSPRDVAVGFSRDPSAGVPRGFVVRDDGEVQIVHPGRFMQFYPSREDATADEPSLGPSLAVCPHPTSIAIKNSNRRFAVACRGDQVVQIVRLTEDGAIESVQEVRDAALRDPVAAAFNDRGQVLTVADFHGRQVINYTTGPYTDFCGVEWDLTDEGAPLRGGSLEIEGTPWLLSGANVN